MHVRALALGVPNAKYLAFGTPNTTKPLTSNVPNVKRFSTGEQYRSKFGTVQTQMLKKKKKIKILIFYLPPLTYFFISIPWV